MKSMLSRNLPQLEMCGFLWRFQRLGGVTLPPMRLGEIKAYFGMISKKNQGQISESALDILLQVKIWSTKAAQMLTSSSKARRIYGFFKQLVQVG